MPSGRSRGPSYRYMPWPWTWRKHKPLGEKHHSVGEKKLNHYAHETVQSGEIAQYSVASNEQLVVVLTTQRSKSLLFLSLKDFHCLGDLSFCRSAAVADYLSDNAFWASHPMLGLQRKWTYSSESSGKLFDWQISTDSGKEMCQHCQATLGSGQRY